MDQSTLKGCCFCHNTFKSLGNHYKGCPERNGADYQHLLSQRTLDNKSKGKAKKLPCPKCGKRFIRLEAHLRNNASCKNITLPAEHGASPPPPPPPVSSTTALSPSPAPTPQPPTLLPRAKLPTTPEQWAEVDAFIHTNITPAVLHEGDVNKMQHVITHGLYTYLVSRIGVMSDNHHRQHHRRDNVSASKLNAIREATAQKKQAKKELQQLRKSGTSPEEVRLLAQKFHLLVRQHSKLVKEARQLTAKVSAKQQRKGATVTSTSLPAGSWMRTTTPQFGHPLAGSRQRSTSPECTLLHPRPSVDLSGCQSALSHPCP